MSDLPVRGSVDTVSAARDSADQVSAAHVSAARVSTDRVSAVSALVRAVRVFERASDDLTVADYRVLAQIVAGEERASRLAHRLALGKPTVSATVESLSKRGLIVRGTVEGDARATSLSLTDEGAKHFERMEGHMIHLLEQLAARTDDPEGVIQSLAALDGAIDEALTERYRKAGA
ncbi:MarR family winged helix-turn-helix transcriptional regulator [Frondihabitans cladoniiphilus]|uniref:HTH marR-type domain-containing protein n=1 Tax=Frondihabitans cladoniiphilus TaxID=715785 RepID=A0ABP8W5R5_9MICO